jgi:aminoglycoside phosphotransferase (APT) family kinase protein
MHGDFCEGEPDQAITRLVDQSGLVPREILARYTRLTGGVASDIWKVEAGGRVFAVKKALSKLRVARDWSVPVSRNASEVDWLRAAADVVADAVPAVLAHDAGLGAFAMAYLDPRDYPNWKQLLREGQASPKTAAEVGRIIAAIHAATAGREDIAARFENDDVFHAIRLEPYLEATADAHPDLGETLMALSRSTLATKLALIHGDVSPKNILIGPKGPVLLDAECACFGDPAFDVAFCLNHLLLKALLTPSARERFDACFRALAEAYVAGVSWEPPAVLETRAARLLQALFLARVDGKSPVEYLTEEADKNRVRRTARRLIADPPARLTEIVDLWAKERSR